MLPIYKLHILSVAALALLTFGIMVLMGKRRFKAIRSGKIPPGYFKDYQQREPFLIPEEVQLANRNYVNLFEMPILFYTFIFSIILTDKADNVTLMFSWLFVLTRYIHSYIHVTSNKLILRMRIFVAGSLILLLLWVRFFVQLLAA